jgi:hypothetical protein
MSLVHTNKTLQRLTRTKTMRWKERRFEILDREALAKIATTSGRSRARAGRSSDGRSATPPPMSNLMVTARLSAQVSAR